MSLASQRIHMKRLGLSELQGNYVQWFNDAEVCKYNSHGETVYTKEMAVEFINSLEQDMTREVYAVYLTEKNVHIGNISLQCIDVRHRNAELAYIFGEKLHWGKGYAQEATQTLLRRAFHELKLHRVYFGTHVANHAMRRLGEKLGFTHEGILREAQCKGGVFYSVALYAMLRKDYLGGGNAIL